MQGLLKLSRAIDWLNAQVGKYVIWLILASTARRNSPGSAGWTQEFGLWHHPEFGFGTVDAAGAVAAASTWTSVGEIGRAHV